MIAFGNERKSLRRVVWSLSAVVLAVGLVGLSGCGGGGSGDDPSGFDSQLESDKPISELGDDEHAQLCRDLTKYANKQWKATLDTFCTANAHATVAASDPSPADDAEARTQCKEQKQRCKDSASDQQITDADCSGDFGDPQCDVKVSVVEKCMTQIFEQLRGIYSGQPACSDVQASYYEDYESPDYESENPESCETVEEKCPNYELDIFGGSDSSDQCGDSENLVRYDADGDGTKEEFCARSCSGNADCMSGRECTAGYCIPAN